MVYKTLKIESSNNICVMSFNRPNKLNAFDAKMVVETQEAIKSISDDDSVKVLIITGIGKGFSAGAERRGNHG